MVFRRRLTRPGRILSSHHQSICSNWRMRDNLQMICMIWISGEMNTDEKRLQYPECLLIQLLVLLYITTVIIDH